MSNTCKYWDCGWCYALDNVETNADSQSACVNPSACPYLLTGEEGAIEALRRTFEENSEAMRILAMGDKEEMEDAIDTLLALEREKDGYEPITLDELSEL